MFGKIISKWWYSPLVWAICVGIAYFGNTWLTMEIVAVLLVVMLGLTNWVVHTQYEKKTDKFSPENFDKVKGQFD